MSVRGVEEGCKERVQGKGAERGMRERDKSKKGHNLHRHTRTHTHKHILGSKSVSELSSKAKSTQMNACIIAADVERTQHKRQFLLRTLQPPVIQPKDATGKSNARSSALIFLLGGGSTHTHTHTHTHTQKRWVNALFLLLLLLLPR